MDGAAKSIDKVALRILPDRPHHLSLTLGRKYPSPNGFWFDGDSSPLQYLTFVSDADRGILITQPSYEICEDPEPTAPPPMSTKILAKGETKKKLSFKDYQKKKTGSPSENDISSKPEQKPNGAPHPRDVREESKKEDARPRDKTDSRQDSHRQDAPRSERPRPEQNGERERYACSGTRGGAVVKLC